MTLSGRSSASDFEGREDTPVFYSVYSELVDLRRSRGNSVHFGGQEFRPKRRSSLSSIYVQVPKLDVAQFDLRTHLEVVNPRQRQ
jgi:hypothetical protein